MEQTQLNDTRILSIEGNIGTGKTTLLQELAQAYDGDPGVVFLQEPLDVWDGIKDRQGETILEKYYKDQDTYAFPFQMMAYV